MMTGDWKYYSRRLMLGRVLAVSSGFIFVLISLLSCFSFVSFCSGFREFVRLNLKQ